MRLRWSTRRWAMKEVAKTVRSINVPPPPAPSRGFWRDFVFNMRNVYATASIFGLVALVYFSPGNIEIFDPIQEALADFSFNDIVFAEWRKESEPVDQNIIIVHVGRNRAEIAAQVKILAAMQPKVIGIDPIFSSEKEPEIDAAFRDALQSAENVVLAAELTEWREKTSNTPELFEKIRAPHPKFRLPHVSFGHVNFFTEGEAAKAHTIREFEPQYIVRDSSFTTRDTAIRAFALEVAARFKPRVMQEIQERGEKREVINYRGGLNKFILIDIEPDMSIDSAVAMYGSLVRGKIVLLGFMGQPFNNPYDIRSKFYTPASEQYVGKSVPDMYAIVLHANIISMLISGEYIQQMPEWLGYAMAIVVCFFNMALFYWISVKLPSFAGGEMKVIQLLQSVLLVGGSMLMLYNLDYQMDIALTLAIILISSDVMEIHESSVKRLIELLQEHRR
ncbi:MAG: CHASE2 domain-containing protein [Bacteroidota bacterium]|nr:CHASE2 domain-containing protein [Candidatus Kapabacteria bacterium]MDW8221211.1 CHASE2 domain-containing protein [Bacteroidota bacterium]